MLIALNDMLLENSVSEKTVELETKYQTLKKEKLLLEQQQETRRQRFIVYRVSVLALIIAIIAFLIYRQQRLKHRQMAQEFKLKLAIVEVEKQNKLQEQRLAISRDLHDNIGSHLTFIISSIDNLKHVYGEQNSAMSEKFYALGNFTKATIQELRDTIWAMNSNEISFEDLEIQLLNYINKAKNYLTGVSFEFKLQKNIKHLTFSSIEGMNIYRAVQEALNNSLKYAEATLISIDISQINNTSTICISDNGKGFDADKVIEGNGFKNMEKRMQDIGGAYRIQSSSKGTCVSLEVPMSRKNSINVVL
jgi:signal transduction histidine kinase